MSLPQSEGNTWLSVGVMILDPKPYFLFSASPIPLVLCSWSLIPYSFPHVPLGLSPNHLTSHLMDHLTILQSTITCHHSAVCSTPQYHHSTHYGLPAHDVLFLDHQLMMELYLELPAHDEPSYMWLYYSWLLWPVTSHLYISAHTFSS